MVRRYYDKTEDTGDGNPFRGHQGFLGDAHIRRAGGADMPIRELPPFLRALLVMDGTVTKILEAYFWEPVEVVTLRQEFVHAERPIPWIRIDPGDRVLIRRARLNGIESKRAYATAFSVIRTQLMPEAFKLQLISRRIGIGVLIRDSGLESYREVLEIGIEPAGGSGDPTALDESDLVFRTYRILIDGEPVILITEHFPLDLYR
ncbi:chorismate--pyruvate lyase family protein [Candidatus Thiosymbion oneisti]|uniref:chorismate--pyruvate lyase family protein n=1 Tax=Candidatus Thiosymbion oneisti TaxID=589554 RepID=UPI00105E0ED0|nr:chorismate pyruvate-lyase family protein [Candidatus Thiosymbion oneisti]